MINELLEGNFKFVIEEDCPLQAHKKAYNRTSNYQPTRVPERLLAPTKRSWEVMCVVRFCFGGVLTKNSPALA
jgi:hypothetical protein